MRADGTGPVRNLTPGPFQHHGVAWLADSSGVVTSAQRHDGWDRDLADDLYVVAARRRDPRPDQADRQLRASRRCRPDGSTVAFIGSDDPTIDPQNAKVGVIPVTGGAHRWISERPRPHVRHRRPGTRPPVWVDDDTLLATAEDRGDTHLYRVVARRRRRPSR